MLTIRTVFAAAGGIILAIAVASTASADEKRNHLEQRADARHTNGSGGAAFGALPACEVSHAAGQMQFVSSRNPFRGGRAGGAYGDIFFASGGASVASFTSGGTSGATRAAEGSTPSVMAPFPGAHPAPPTTSGGPTAGASPTANAPANAPPAMLGSPIVGGPAGPPAATVALTGAPVAVNPEPASLLLLGTGLGSILLARRRGRHPKG